MNRAFFGIAALTALTGCPTGAPDCDSGTILDTATNTCVVDNSCTNTIITGSEFPGIAATNAYYRTTVEAKLQEEEADATISLSEASGAAVAGTAVTDGKRLIFTPDAPLAPSTDYTVTVSYCAGDPSWDFKTSEVGGSTDESGLVGNVYSLDLASGRFVQPEGVGPLLQEYLTTSILIGVNSVESGKIQMLGAIAEDGTSPPTQSQCSPTIPFPEADFSGNPFFKVGPETTTLSIEGYSITIDDLLVSGAFSPDGSYISGAVLSGKIDTRPLVPLLNPEGEPDEICNLAATIGVSCEPCLDGENLCLSLYVDNIAAEEVGGTVVALHSPGTDPVPAGSTDFCDNSVCSTEDECAAR